MSGLGETNLVAEVGEPPYVCQVDGEPDDGEEEVDVAVPGDALALWLH